MYRNLYCTETCTVQELVLYRSFYFTETCTVQELVLYVNCTGGGIRCLRSYFLNPGKIFKEGNRLILCTGCPTKHESWETTWRWSLMVEIIFGIYSYILRNECRNLLKMQKHVSWETLFMLHVQTMYHLLSDKLESMEI